MELSTPRIRRPISKPFAKLKWTALGTSITQDVYESYVQHLAALSGMELIANLAIIGSALSSSSSSNAATILSQIDDIPPETEVVTIECGINDFRLDSTLGTIYDTDDTTYCGALNKAIADILAKNWFRTVIVVAMWPNTPSDDNAGVVYPNISQANGNGDTGFDFIEATRKVCLRNNVMFCPPVGMGGPTWAAYARDGVHNSDLGDYRHALSIHAQLKSYAPTKLNWNLRPATISDLSGWRCTPSSIDGSGIVQVTGLPVSGTNWAALWMTGDTNKACEFEIADPSLGVWFLCGETSANDQVCGIGDPEYGSNGTLNIGSVRQAARFSATSQNFGVPHIASNELGAYPLRYRMARTYELFVVWAYIDSKWKPLINIDLFQQSVAGLKFNTFTLQRSGILISQSNYSRVKNVKVGTLELR